MATSAKLFPGARVSTHRIAPNTRGLHVNPQLGTVVGRDSPGIGCKCGCGGYWAVRWDGFHDMIAFMAHDLKLLEVVDQLAYRAQGDTNG